MNERKRCPNMLLAETFGPGGELDWQLAYLRYQRVIETGDVSEGLILPESEQSLTPQQFKFCQMVEGMLEQGNTSEDVIKVALAYTIDMPTTGTRWAQQCEAVGCPHGNIAREVLNRFRSRSE